MVIEITDFGKKKLDEKLKEKEGKGHFRFYVAGRNWSGPTFGLVLEEPKEEEIELITEGYKFAMEDWMEQSYKKFAIDYIVDKYRSGFVARGQKL